MVTIYDVPTNDLIDEVSRELENIQSVQPPSWAPFVKTGMHKERPPAQENWWHIRSAAILRQVARLGPIGVSKLRTKYGGKKDRGHKPEHTYKGSGNIIRTILQQLEDGGLVKQVERNGHKGRIVTPVGQKLLDGCALKLKKEVADAQHG